MPAHEPEGFRALLNSFLPRKRAISQMLVRDRDGRVLVCRLTYKQDWDLPGGVVEVGESPQPAVAREVEEELALSIPAGPLLLTDWLPPWSGWDDALCLVFDGGAHDARSSTTWSGRSARSATPRSARPRRCASGAPTSPRAGSSRPSPTCPAAPRPTPSPVSDQQALAHPRVLARSRLRSRTTTFPRDSSTMPSSASRCRTWLTLARAPPLSSASWVCVSGMTTAAAPVV